MITRMHAIIYSQDTEADRDSAVTRSGYPRLT